VTIFGHSFPNDKLVNERRAKTVIDNNMVNDVILMIFISGIYRFFIQGQYYISA
jgi:hypothetical protein